MYGIIPKSYHRASKMIEGKVDISIAVKMFLEHLTAEAGLAKNTIAAYRRDLQPFLRFLEASKLREVSAINPEIVLKYLKWRKNQGVAPSTFARNLVSIRL